MRRVVLTVLVAVLGVVALLSVASEGGIPPTQPRKSEILLKVKEYYQEQNPKLWDGLAEYQAAATLKASRKHNVKLSLLVGVVTAESNANPFAVSRTGAKGPGQVDFKAHGDRFSNIKSESDKFDPEKNIDCAAELLKEYTEKYGTVGGLQAYNIGETAYRKGKRNMRYVAKVKKYSTKYQRS